MGSEPALPANPRGQRAAPPIFGDAAQRADSVHRSIAPVRRYGLWAVCRRASGRVSLVDVPTQGMLDGPHAAGRANSARPPPSRGAFLPAASRSRHRWRFAVEQLDQRLEERRVLIRQFGREHVSRPIEGHRHHAPGAAAARVGHDRGPLSDANYFAHRAGLPHWRGETGSGASEVHGPARFWGTTR